MAKLRGRERAGGELSARYGCQVFVPLDFRLICLEQLGDGGVRQELKTCNRESGQIGESNLNQGEARRSQAGRRSYRNRRPRAGVSTKVQGPTSISERPEDPRQAGEVT